jgi:phosphonate transport system substrate-binding protein
MCLRDEMKKHFVLIIFICVFIAGMTGCSNNEGVVEINLSNTQKLDTKTNHSGNEIIKIAVGGMITPKEGFMYYKRFLDYIGDRLGKKVKFIDKESYAVINDMLEHGAFSSPEGIRRNGLLFLYNCS